ncbi:PREDICTED: group 3 secretory phospholipase A2-like [Calidris pugnax]|uniref:group 3 secretory phospholipase A2-like n=1 Tax=Calidris pugnax TaxID=198806 RepID=UPI00071DDE50|nr:PREDICTED: group 3 secretory phospholipase A2-like [Calidris pugnax]
MTGSTHGLFRGPDRCCREHDQCSAQITALQFNYGIRNYRLHTVSHCDCDARFRQCLLALNDTISNIIGVTFFNLLEVPCFVLEESEECIQWHWWGGCERYGVVPLARMVQQNQYHYSPPMQEVGSSAVQPPGKGKKSSRTGRKQLRQRLGQNPRLRQAQRPASTRDKAEPATRHPAAQWGLEPGPPTEMTVLEQDLAGGKRVPAGTQHRAGGSAHPACTQDGSIRSRLAPARCGDTPLPDMDMRRQHGPRRVCRYYKHLDKCEHHIAPNEVKYQLHNTGTQMLFHCNCTHRLARSLHRARNLSDVEVAVLADHITTDCFVLEPPADCSPGKGPQHNCNAVTRALLVPARHLKKTLRHWGLPHATSKAKLPDWKTQDSDNTLYERCLRLVLEQKPAVQHHAVLQ